MRILFLLTVIISLCGCSPRNGEKKQAAENEIPQFFWDVDWQPGSDRIAVGGTQDSLKLFSTEGLQRIKSYAYPGTITKTKWHPTKNRLAVSVQDGLSASTILNLDDDVSTSLDSVTSFGARAIGWNRTGDLLAVGDYEGFLNIYDDAGNFLRKVNTNQKGIIDLDWHPAENLIVAVGENIALNPREFIDELLGSDS